MTTDPTAVGSPLAEALATVLRQVPIRLGPNSLAMAQRGAPIVLTPQERDEVVALALADPDVQRALDAIRAEAVREHKAKKLQIHFDPPPTREVLVHVRTRCPRCGGTP